MTKYIYILIFSIAFSNGYNHIINNELDYSQDYTFEDFLSKLKGKGVGRFASLWSGGVQSEAFTFIPYLDIIEYDRKEPDAAYYTSSDGSIEIMVTSENFQETGPAGCSNLF